MTNSTWYTLPEGNADAIERLEKAWPDAPTDNLEICGMLLEVAQEDVIAYAPTPLAGENILTAPKRRYVYAQVQQARNLWNAGRVNSDGEIGAEFNFTPRPLDKTIQSIIRPRDVKPHVL
jgi:hypothetical protein